MQRIVALCKWAGGDSPGYFKNHCLALADNPRECSR